MQVPFDRSVETSLGARNSQSETAAWAAPGATRGHVRDHRATAIPGAPRAPSSLKRVGDGHGSGRKEPTR